MDANDLVNALFEEIGAKEKQIVMLRIQLSALLSEEDGGDEDASDAVQSSVMERGGDQP